MRALLLAAAVTVSLAVPGGAVAAKPQIHDPAGDVPVPAVDVVSALFRTEGTKAKAGRKTVYTPTKLVVVVTYAGDVATQPAIAQVVAFDAPGCTDVYLETYGETTFGRADCADEFEFTSKVSGRTLTVSLPFSFIGKEYLRKGAVLRDLRTYTAVADPAMGYESGELGGNTGFGPLDDARTTATYKIS